MPNIEEYNAGNLGLRPSEAGISAAEVSGRRMDSFSREEGQAIGGAISRVGGELGRAADQHVALGEIGRGALGLTQMYSGLNDKWNKARNGSDPNDTTIAANFQQNELEPALEQFKGAFSTEAAQKWALDRTDSMRQHFFEKTTADMSTRAGDAAILNYKQNIDHSSQSAYSDPTEHTADMLMGNLDASLAAAKEQMPNMTPQQEAQLNALALHGKGEIAKGAIRGMADAGDDGRLQAIKTLGSGKYSDYITQEERTALGQHIGQQAVAARADKHLQEAEQDRLAQRASEDQAERYISQWAVKDGNGQLTGEVRVPPGSAAQVLNDPKLKAAERLTLMRAGSEITKTGDAQTKGEVFRSILDGVTDGTVKQQDIIGHVGKDLSMADANFALNLLKQPEHAEAPVFKAAMSGVKSALTYEMPGLPGKDPVGQGNYASFFQHFYPQYVAKTQAGTLEPNALDVNDPNSMISKAMQPFKRTPQQMIADRVEEMGGIKASDAIASPAPASVKEGTEDKAKDGRPIIFKNGRWEYK